MGFQFLYQLNGIFKEYFGKKYTEDTIRDNFTLVYELLDETMDYGYPQNCSIDVLKMYINLGQLSVRIVTLFKQPS
jgi:AP-2 complex subunit mu-1